MTAARSTARAVEAWFAREGRPLPWRTSPRDPYVSLVSEFMLQQTQVSRVIDRIRPFLARFPDVRTLADADESDVLALWSGLGYYQRARRLLQAARAIRDRHDGVVPADTRSLEALPGIGRYTAGAISSIVFAQRAPIVDGNVARVLVRLSGRDAAHDDPAARRWAWEQADELVSASTDPARFNEGLMELGAVVCTPRAPRCEDCPLRAGCVAAREGRQEDLPRPATRTRVKDLYCASVIVRDARARLLVEQRDGDGLWASLWQAPTIEREDRAPTTAEVRRFIGTDVRRAGAFIHQTTHRRVRFALWEAQGARAGNGRVWRSRRALAGLGLSSAQRRVLLAD